MVFKKLKNKNPTFPQKCYNVYMYVFLEYFLHFSFNDWLVVVFMKILEFIWSSAYLPVFLLPSIHSPFPTALCNNIFSLLTMPVLFVVDNYSICCLLTKWFIPSKVNVVNNAAYSNCCCWQLGSFHQLLTICLFHLLLLLRVLPISSAIIGMMLTALPIPPIVLSILFFNPPYLLYLWATTLVFGLSSR